MVRWRRLSTVAVVLLAGLALSRPTESADAPAGAVAPIDRLMQAYRANDPVGFLAALADDYMYNGLTKTDIVPFGDFWVLYDRLLYQIVSLTSVSAGTATAIVDAQFSGRYRLEALDLGQPRVSGRFRLWLEVRRQPAGEWRVAALRPVRLRFQQDEIPFTWVEKLAVNGGVSLQVRPGASLEVEGQTSFGFSQRVQIGSSSKELELNYEPHEAWRADLQAPTLPGRYYVDAISLILVPREEGGLYLAYDEMTIPVVVR